ncbi:MAG: hypothetical protein ACR2IT_09555 [Pirellulales bacterium]
MTTTMTAYDFRSAAAAGLGKRATTAESTAGGTAVTTASHDGTYVTIIHDAGEGAIDGTVGSLGVPAPVAGDAIAWAMISGSDLGRIVRGIVPAADTETSRYALGGTLVEIAEGSTMAVVATDGRRIHIGHLQPAAIEGTGSAIVSVDQWTAFHAAIRGTLRASGIGGRKIDAALARGTVTVRLYHHHDHADGMVVILRWLSAAADGRLTVEALALAIAGRFPRWRDVCTTGGQRLTIDAAAVAEALDDHAVAWKAAERAARAAWKAEREEAKRTRRYCPSSSPGINRAIVTGPAGIAGVAVAGWASAVPASAVPVHLDHAFVAEALAGAAAWGGGPVEVRTIDDTSPVTIEAGEYGTRFAAVIMPMAV